MFTIYLYDIHDAYNPVTEVSDVDSTERGSPDVESTDRDSLVNSSAQKQT